jgi:hypothetical protein
MRSPLHCCIDSESVMRHDKIIERLSNQDGISPACRLIMQSPSIVCVQSPSIVCVQSRNEGSEAGENKDKTERVLNAWISESKVV